MLSIPPLPGWPCRLPRLSMPIAWLARYLLSTALVRDSPACLPVWLRVSSVICHCTHLSTEGEVPPPLNGSKAVRPPEPLGKIISAALTLNTQCQSEAAGPMARPARDIWSRGT